MNFAISIILWRTGAPHARLHRCGRIYGNNEQPCPAQTAPENISSVEDFLRRSCPSEPVPFVRYSNRYPSVTGVFMQYALLAYGRQRTHPGPLEVAIADVLARPYVAREARLSADESATTVPTGS